MNIVILPSWLPTPFSTGFRMRARAPLLFDRKTSYSSHPFLHRSITSLVFCPRSCRPSPLPSPQFVPFVSPETKPTMSSVEFLPQVFQSHRSPEFPQIPFHTRPSQPSQSFLYHRQEHWGIWEHSLLPARFCNHHCRTSVDSDFYSEVVEFLFLDAHRDSN